MFKTKGTLTKEDCEWLLTASASDIKHRYRHDPRLVNRDMTSWRLKKLKVGSQWNLLVTYGIRWLFWRDIRPLTYSIRAWWIHRKMAPIIAQWNLEHPPSSEFVKSTITIKDGHAALVSESVAPVIE